MQTANVGPGERATPAEGRNRPRSRPAALLHLARPRQWVKNVLVFAAPGVAGVLTQREAPLTSAVME